MTTDSSATLREETPHVTETTQFTISDALRRRAQSVINDRWIEPQWRSIIHESIKAQADRVEQAMPDFVKAVLRTIDS